MKKNKVIIASTLLIILPLVILSGTYEARADVIDSNTVCDHPYNHCLFWNYRMIVNMYPYGYYCPVYDFWTAAGVAGHRVADPYWHYTSADYYFQSGYGMYWSAQSSIQCNWLDPYPNSYTPPSNYIFGIEPWPADQYTVWGYRSKWQNLGDPVSSGFTTQISTQTQCWFKLPNQYQLWIWSGVYWCGMQHQWATIRIPGSPMQSVESSTSITKQLSQSLEIKPQFDIDVVYSYVGPRQDNFTEPNPMQTETSMPNTLYAKTLYPSLTWLNVTYTPSVVESCDAKIEIFLIQLTSNTGATERYLYSMGTNYNPSFSNLDALPPAINSQIGNLVDINTIDAGASYFAFNLTAGQSTLATGVGSLGIYTSKPSELGLWSVTKPDSVILNVSRLGWITLNGSSASTTKSLQDAAQIQLQPFGNGFVSNKILSDTELSQINPLNPQAQAR